MTIVQIIGKAGAGKTESINRLSKIGFAPVLISDLIRTWAECTQLRLKQREDYAEAHAQMLISLGKFAIPELILAMPNERVGVDGLRVPEHSESLHQDGPIIALHCPFDKRVSRILKRAGPLDSTSSEELRAYEEREAQNTEPFSLNTEAVMATADFHIDSSQPIEMVYHEIKNALRTY